MTHHLIPSLEAEWTGPERAWAGIQQFPERKRSSWPLVVIGAACVVLAIFILNL